MPILTTVQYELLK